MQRKPHMWFPLIFYSLNAAKSDFISRSALFLRQFALKSPVYQGFQPFCTVARKRKTFALLTVFTIDF